MASKCAIRPVVGVGWQLHGLALSHSTGSQAGSEPPANLPLHSASEKQHLSMYRLEIVTFFLLFALSAVRILQPLSGVHKSE